MITAGQRTTFKLVTTSVRRSNFVKTGKRMKKCTTIEKYMAENMAKRMKKCTEVEVNMGGMAKKTLRRKKALEA